MITALLIVVLLFVLAVTAGSLYASMTGSAFGIWWLITGGLDASLQLIGVLLEAVAKSIE